jgi:hypothetical protein
MMSKPGAGPPSGISSVDVLIPTERHPACRQRESRPGCRTERENLAGDAAVRALGRAVGCQRRPDPRKFATHSMRPDEGDPDLPPHGELASGPAVTRAHADRSTVRYLGVEIDDGLEIAEKIDV